VVDFTKRARKAPGLEPGESVLAAIRLTPSRQSGAAVAGAVAGGAVGLTLGTLWDALGQPSLPEELANAPVADVKLPNAGVIAAFTDRRLLLWKASSLGGPKRLLAAFPRDEIVGARVRPAGRRGGIASAVVFLLFADGSVLPAWAITSGSNGRQLEAFLAAGGDGREI